MMLLSRTVSSSSDKAEQVALGFGSLACGVVAVIATYLYMQSKSRPLAGQCGWLTSTSLGRRQYCQLQSQMVGMVSALRLT